LDEGEKSDGLPEPAPPAVEGKAVVDHVFGSGTAESQYSSRLMELIEEAENEGKAPVVFPAEPRGLVTSGLNRKVSGEVSFPLNEVALAVSASEPRRIAVGANATTDVGLRQAMFVSRNGGRTFRFSLLPTTSATTFLESDPTLAWESDGTLWAATIEGQGGATGLALKGQTFTSDDEGATWTYAGSFSGSERISDRPTLWIDSSSSSSFRGSRYVTWHSGAAYVTRRSAEATEWSAPVRVSPTDAHCFGGDLKTDAAGRIYTFWPDTNRKTIFVAISDDGGVGFSSPVAVAPVEKPFNSLVISAAGRSPLNHVTAAVWKRFDTRRAFVAWYDPAKSPNSGSRIWFAASSDGGATWTAPIEASPVPGFADQFHPVLAVDSRTGRLALSFTDTTGDPSGLTTRRAVVISNDFGRSWSEPQPLSTERSNVLTGQGLIYGDYQSMVTHGARSWAAWTDRRTTAATSIWLAEFRMLSIGVVLKPISGASKP
jgi:hypothetical protein